MTVIARKALTDFSKEQPGSSDALLAWFRITCESDWSCLRDVKESFNSVDYVGNDLYVFNIRGNKYRLIARIIFRVRTVFIRWIGTHREYDDVNLDKL
ncbi:type II toxin-antitoxin system HigB family toxin [Chitinophaga barathri]|uniref:Type II toxin-antitoxin system HigB family toxin n=1 Tax=Chitinophaga barathri TaxID=1647451 RepID=A0A3N4MH11_9BACT|nr:type II toxin-antitoxin system HigB family toxin [Chitinophaga barathri]RPD38929.1 type II toxin-antitoxin system HigB family toxin [Chitinophaga barathri]